MILAAGRGERLKPLTDNVPKALVPLREKPLIVYHLEKLAQAGFKEVVINLGYLGEKIQQLLGDGSSFGVSITYSPEKEGALETGGGIFNALPLLGEAPFITVNADIFTDFDFTTLKTWTLSPSALAHLILVPCQTYNANGNFSLDASQLVRNQLPYPYLASGITLYHPQFFEGLSSGKYSVTPLWRRYADEGRISGTVFHGLWYDIGTLERLNACNLRLEQLSRT